MSTIKTNQLAHTANGASVYTLPQTDGSAGQVLRTDGSGNLSWANDSGVILQVKQTDKTDTFDGNATTFSDITGLSVSITPSATTSKILVRANLLCGISSNSYVGFRLMRDSTAIGLPDAISNSTRSGFGHGAVSSANQNYKLIQTGQEFLDSPSSTSAITYKIQYIVWSSTFYINRPVSLYDDRRDMLGKSSLTVMEVAA